MVLLTSLNTALTGLQANIAALQTIGHNISNASTPGFSRQRVELDARSAQLYSFGSIGTGVDITRVRRLVDLSLEARLRDASSSLGTLSSSQETLERLESLFHALEEEDLGGMLDRFFESIDVLANNPDNLSARSQVLQNAKSLAESINHIAVRIRESRALTNDEVLRAVDEVNRLTSELADLNRQILLAENGGVDLDSANDLRDRRDLLLRQLSEYIEIHSVETSTGEVNVLAGSAFLVFGQQSFALATDDTVDAGVLVSTPVFENGTAALVIGDGKLRGLLDSRDEILKGFLQELDVLAHAVIQQFNQVQSTGQGLERFSQLTSLYRVQDAADVLAIDGTVTSSVVGNTIVDTSLIGFPDLTGRTIRFFSGDAALESRLITAFDPASGTLVLEEAFGGTPQLGDRYQITDLSFPVENGSFQLVVTNELTGLQESFTITVDLDKSLAAGPVLTDSSLADIVAQLNAASPFLTASVDATNHVEIRSTSADVRFSFAQDTSGFLAAVGLNPFFSGVNAESMAVHDDLLRHPERLSAAQSNAAGDNANAIAFGALRILSAVDEASFEELYQNLVGRLGVETAEMRHRSENQQFVLQQLQNQRERMSGVNIDEEAVKMLQYQRAFQATARFIGVVDSLMETLLGAV